MRRLLVGVPVLVLLTIWIVGFAEATPITVPLGSPVSFPPATDPIFTVPAGTAPTTVPTTAVPPTDPNATTSTSFPESAELPDHTGALPETPKLPSQGIDRWFTGELLILVTVIGLGSGLLFRWRNAEESD